MLAATSKHPDPDLLHVREAQPPSCEEADRKGDGLITKRNNTGEPWMEASICSLQTGEISHWQVSAGPGECGGGWRAVKLVRPGLHVLDTDQQTKRFGYQHLNMEMELN